MSRMPNAFLMWRWQWRISRMRRCKTASELRARYGSPDHEIEAGSMTIWHYPLRVVGEVRYSIHVVVVDDRLSQIYMHMEPIAA